MSPTEPVVEVLDARGVRCPMPVIMLARLAAARPAGGTVAVRWTDPAAATDIPAWARMRGHRTPSDEAADAIVAATAHDADLDDLHGAAGTPGEGWSVVVLTPQTT